MRLEAAESGERLDAYLAARTEMSRSAVKRLLDEGCVTVNGRIEKVSYKVQAGDVIEYEVPPVKPSEIAAEEIPLDVVYEDEDLLVINKPKGMVVHPAPGSRDGTLVNALLAHTPLSAVGGVERPGIVHRLDKDTSGLMVVAKNDATHRSLSAQIEARTATRKYLAIVHGNPRFEKAEVDAPIGRHPADRKKMAVVPRGRPAVTFFKVLERFGDFTLLEATLRTGRTHQVRVHAAYAGHPVAGDPVYSRKRIPGLTGQALHAYYLAFDHRGERREFTAPMPDEMAEFLETLRCR
ncbi:MAG: RluA family pseudouridine synthase [Armatimonadota bacterium]